MSEKHTVLFLCSGNFYRSRYAEALFNYAAARRLPHWEAESFGFKPHLAKEELAWQAREALAAKRIPISLTREKPTKVSARNLIDATLVVALLEKEHRPMMRKDFPVFENHTIYWNVRDIDEIPAEEALPLIEELVETLVEELETGSIPSVVIPVTEF